MTNVGRPLIVGDGPVITNPGPLLFRRGRVTESNGRLAPDRGPSSLVKAPFSFDGGRLSEILGPSSLVGGPLTSDIGRVLEVTGPLPDVEGCLPKNNGPFPAGGDREASVGAPRIRKGVRFTRADDPVRSYFVLLASLNREGRNPAAGAGGRRAPRMMYLVGHTCRSVATACGRHSVRDARLWPSMHGASSGAGLAPSRRRRPSVSRRPWSQLAALPSSRRSPERRQRGGHMPRRCGSRLRRRRGTAVAACDCRPSLSHRVGRSAERKRGLGGHARGQRPHRARGNRRRVLAVEERRRRGRTRSRVPHHFRLVWRVEVRRRKGHSSVACTRDRGARQWPEELSGGEPGWAMPGAIARWV